MEIILVLIALLAFGGLSGTIITDKEINKLRQDLNDLRQDYEDFIAK